VPIIYLASPMGFLYQLDAEFAGRSGFVAIWGGSGVQPDQLAVMLSLVGQYVLVHGIIALICLTWAARELRSTTRSAPPRPLPRPVKLSEWGPEAPQPALARIHKPILFPADHGYPMGDRPLLWREAYQGGSPTNTGFLIDMLTMLFCVFLIVQIVLLLSVLSNAGSEFYLFVQEYINPCIKVGTIILGLLLCVSVAFRAAGTFSRERDQKTLDSLLLLPIPRRSILVAKWLGSILRFRRLIWLLLALWAFGVVITALHPLAAVALAVALALHVALLATIGVWLSLACRNTVSAYFATALLLMLLFLGSWLVLLNTAIAGPTASFYGIWLERFLEIGLNPIVCWWHLAANWRTTTGLLADLGVLRWFDTAALSAGLLVFALLGLLVWHAAEERLGGEPRMLNPGGATPHPQSSKTRPGA
jgi:ABC-type transport system involved in multi-copper enzyme maturation permease subunit